MIGDILQPSHLLFVLVIALLVLGPKRLPEVGRSLGRGLRDFRSALSGDEHHNEVVADTGAPTEYPDPHEEVATAPTSEADQATATHPTVQPEQATATPQAATAAPAPAAPEPEPALVAQPTAPTEETSPEPATAVQPAAATAAAVPESAPEPAERLG